MARQAGGPLAGAHTAPPLAARRATGRGGANGSLRFELGRRPNTNQNLINGAALCDKWRTVINQLLAVDPKVGPRVQGSRRSSGLVAAALPAPAPAPSPALNFGPCTLTALWLSGMAGQRGRRLT